MSVDPNRFQKLERVLEAVWHASPERRDEVLNEHCGDDEELRLEAEKLIAHDEAECLLDTPTPLLEPEIVLKIAAENFDSERTTRPENAKRLEDPDRLGTRVGSYEIVSRLGSGGMGAVYLARRHDDVHRQEVAIKVLDSSFDSLEARERFRAEREILAHLSHPNIASMLDGGTTDDGRPYLVMELVFDGVPIDDFCCNEELTLEDRIRLFLKVCSAVQEAHRSLIVHRDLKPGNILVDSRGEPKLLDFGIAKLLNPGALPRTLLVTATGGQPMTLAYASPEQVAGGKITTAVDVYALGILLYELLTGAKPHDLKGIALPEAIRQICEQAPPKLSSRVRSTNVPDEITGPQGLPAHERRSLERRLAGDLESIVHMALRKEPERRFRSVEALFDDLERYLDGRPVNAAGDSLPYRLGKFVRRHRAAVLATLLVVLLFTTFTGILLLQSHQLEIERDRATLTSDLMLDLFVGVDPWIVEARDPSAATLLDRSRRSLEARTTSAPQVRADLMHKIGRAYEGIGRFAEAERLLRNSLEHNQRLHDGDHPDIADVLLDLAEAVRWQSRADEGLELAREGHGMLGRLGLESTPEGIVATLLLADLLQQQGQFQLAENLYRQGLAVAQQQEHPDLEAIALARLGLAKRRLLYFEESEEILRRALAVNLQVFGDEHPRTATTRIDLGAVFLATSQISAAEKQLTSARQTLVNTTGPEHPSVAMADARLGELALEKGELQIAESLLSAAELSLKRSIGHHPIFADALGARSTVLLQLGRTSDARRKAQEALEIMQSLFGERNISTVNAHHRLAKVEAQTGKLDQARKRLERALEIAIDLTGPASPRTATLRGEAATFEMWAGNFAAAEDQLVETIEETRKLYGGVHVDLAKLHNNLGMLRHQQGKLEKAEGDFRKAIEVGKSALGSDAPRYGIFHTNLARLLESRGNLEGASEALEECGRIFDRGDITRNHPWRLHADRIRAKIMLRKQRLEEVEELLTPWLERFEQDSSFADFERRSTLRLMVRSLEAQNKKSQAEALRNKL